MSAHHPTSSKEVQILFSEIAKSITSSLDSKNVILSVMQQVERYFEPKSWSLFQLDANTQELFFIFAKGIDIDLVKNIRIKMGEGIVGQVAELQKSVLIQDIDTHSQFNKTIDKLTGFETKTIIAVPIIFQNQTLGVIELINTLEDDNFNQNDLDILEIIADFSAIALSNAKAHEDLMKQAISDPLTGLYNRSYLDRMLDNTPVHTKEEKRKSDANNVICVWVDVDHFKEVNDQRGHHVGDEVLVKLSHLLLKCCRQSDYVFRVGGDEFLIVLMNIKRETADESLKRLEKQLAEATSKIMPAPAFSFGIAWGARQDLAKIIIEADNLMYQNKHKYMVRG